jgi:hypothetical protein
LKTWTENSTRVAAAVVATLTMIAVATPASAQYTSDQLKCRQTIAKESAKLAKTIGKVLIGCHKNQQKGKVTAGNDCNDVDAPETDVKGKVNNTKSKMTDKISDPAKGKCTALNVGYINYHQCPSPCDIPVPTIGDASDVAACLICLTETEVEAMVTAAQDSPAPPLGKDDAKCHSGIGKNLTKHLDTALKERPKCQNAAESAGATTVDPACQGSIAKIDTTRTKGEDKVTKACDAPVDLTMVNSCSTVDTTSLNTCLFDDSAARGLTIFEAMYGFGEPTWTAVQSLFDSTGCSSGFCHGGSPGGGNLGDIDDFDLGHDELLIEGVSCATSLFTSRVVAGDPSSSFIMNKLLGTPDCGAQMPLAGVAFNAEQLDIVERWILAGALKN